MLNKSLPRILPTTIPVSFNKKIEEIEDGYTDEVGLDIDAMYHNQFVVDCVAILQELLEGE